MARDFIWAWAEFSCLLFPLIHILPEDLICFTFCTPKFQELVQGALLPFCKLFNYFLLLSFLFVGGKKSFLPDK